MKILHINDDAAFTGQLHRDLTLLGEIICHPQVAHPISEAVQQLKREPYDAVLMDWPLRGRDKFDHCVRIAEESDSAPVIALASMDGNEEAVQVIEAGVDDYLMKCDVDATFLMHRIEVARVRRGQVNARVVASPAGGSLETEEFGEPEGLTSQFVGLSRRPLRVLVGTKDAELTEFIENTLQSSVHCHVTTGVSPSFDKLPKMLRSGNWDTLLLDDRWIPKSSTQWFSEAPNDVPIVVFSKDDEAKRWQSWIHDGAQDWLPMSRCHQHLVRSLRLAIARQRRGSRPILPAGSSLPSEQPQITKPPSERRAFDRYGITKTAVVIPILPDNTPDTALRTDAFTSDVSEEGLGFEISGMARLPTNLLLVGIEADDGDLFFATVEVRNQRLSNGLLRVGCRFADRNRDLIRPQNLLPFYDASKHRYATNLPTATLNAWVSLGIFQPMLMDRILLCPKCKSLPTFRNGCRACGSVRLATQQLIHHFACAYVGFIGEFQNKGHLICPKCRAQNLIVGTDFEHLDGPHRCIDCDWSDTELDVVGQCMQCNWRFSFKQAYEEELIGYHVNRLDPLALIATTG